MTLTAALRDVAERGTGHGVRLFRGDRERERAGFDELYAQAGRVACGLLERGVRPGERVAIALPTSIDFARALFGVLAAGAVPVPVPPPARFASLEIHMRRIVIAMRQSKVRVVLSDAALGSLLGPVLGGDGEEFRVLDIAAVPASSAVYTDVGVDAPALVQYTSGTSEDPKGVVLTHANLLANVEAITKGIGLTDADVGCCWLPLFHDMGLIGALLSSVLAGADTCLMPPEDFLRDPGRWLRVISRQRVTLSAAPNSGYLHALRKVPAEAVRELDLSSWRLTLNGAEPVDAELMRRFCAHFAPAGFRRTAFLPVYGLAEGSLAVTIPPTGREVRSVWVRRDMLGEGIVEFGGPDSGHCREIVSVGVPVTGTEVRLVGEGGGVLHSDAAVGEIHIRGASVMRGYEANEPATRATVGDGGWVSTGDLAFRKNGELYVAGRKKEMIIVFGQNYYASDIESVAGRLPGVAHHGALAATVPFADGDGLVVMVETRETEPYARSELVSRVRYAVSSELGITPREVLLVRKGRLPRTSSGKLLRHGARAVYEQWASASPDAEQPLTTDQATVE
ncbi:AMP-binding protein [Streptomyces sp. ISL-11]|uniref:AMP-binding protein n=1 Tax=Streptomyces sp. ISL-11 TaxID=2819174 RepID=UPI001BE91F61|nr:AMP-binding protein [Streptomyces sp. ISL-11]MBT2382969.1 AMP-binding protein [Streptomyces sp. ISL-11]